MIVADCNRYWRVNKLSESIQVPFISEALIERGGATTRHDIEALFKTEFGDLTGLIVLPDKVTINGQSILDISEQALRLDNKRDKDASPTAPLGTDQSDQSVLSADDEEQQTFRLRTIDNGHQLRIAVHGELNLSLRWQLRKLIDSIKTYPVAGYEVDLSQCHGITVTGIAILLLIKENTGADSENMVVKNCRPAIVERLQWAGMESYFRIAAKQDG